MANAYTQLGFVKQADGENIGSWGDVLNDQLIDLLDDAIGGYVEVSVASGNVTLAFADGTADNNGRHAVIKFTGSPGTTRTVTFPNKQKTYYINNGSDSSVICTAGSGGATVTVLTGNKDIIYVDGSDEIHSVLTRTSVVLGTNTSGNILVADGNQFNSKAVGDLSAISSVAADDVLLAVDTSGGGLKKITRSTLVSGLAAGTMSNISEDSTPQLGGDLDVNGQDIVSTSNGNITLTPNGTGVVRVDGSNGIDMQSGAISIKNSGTQSYVDFYCESSNAHYARLQAPAHSAFAGNITLTMPATTDTLVGRTTTDTLTNKTLTTPVIAEIDSGADITLDATADIILDAGGGDFNFKDDGTEILRITNSSSDVIIRPVVDAKDLIFQQRDGTEVARVEDNGTFNVVSEKLAINGTAITSTAAELNILDGVTSTATELNVMDGDTSATSTTLADADRLVTNDAGTMKQVALTDLKTYLTSAGFSSEDPTALAIALG